MIAWPGVETSLGVYSDVYMTNIQNIINILKAEGIMVILDMHQDIMSRFFCGEGIPDFLADAHSDFPFPLLINVSRDPETNYPIKSECLKHFFGDFLFAKVVGETVQKLYTPGTLLREHYLKFWAQVATFFREEESVLGYELINEPWFGDIYADPLVFVDGYTDREFLAPLYKEVSEVILKADSHHVIIFEPTVADYLLSGFKNCPVAAPEKCVYAYHVYCIDVNQRGSPKSRAFCDVFDDYMIDLRTSDARRLKSAVMVTEFGAVYNDTGSVREISWIMNELDKRLTSWSYWQFKYFGDYTTADHPPWTESLYDPEGRLMVAKVRALARTYAQKTCGIPLTMSFDHLTSDFELKFLTKNCGGLPTVIYMNLEWYYPQGYNLDVVPEGSLSPSMNETNWLELLTRPAVKAGTEVTVTIRKK